MNRRGMLIYGNIGRKPRDMVGNGLEDDLRQLRELKAGRQPKKNADDDDEEDVIYTQNKVNKIKQDFLKNLRAGRQPKKNADEEDVIYTQDYINRMLQKYGFVPPPKSASTKVFESTDLNRVINSFAFTQQQINEISKRVADGVDYFGQILVFIEADIEDIEDNNLIKYRNRNQMKKVKKEVDKTVKILYTMKSLLEDRLNFIAKKYNLNFDDQLLFWKDGIDIMDYVSYYITDINGNATTNMVEEINQLPEFAYENYLDIMKDLELSKEEATRVLNARLKKKKIDVEFI
jgi:hypothetical protein